MGSLQLQFSFILFIVGITWVLFSAVCDGIENIISDPFERSGSVLVLVAVYLDYSFRESAVAEISRSMVSGEYQIVRHYLIKVAVVVRPIAIFSVITGTLIWGYGCEF